MNTLETLDEPKISPEEAQNRAATAHRRYDAGEMNLEQLRDYLNNHCVRCPVAVNQVVLLSTLKSNGRLRKDVPQPAIECKIRSFLGWKKKVYSGFIEKVCCGDYEGQCEAYATFMARRRNSFMAP